MKAFKVKIYPNKAQQKALDANFGCCRFIYNKMIEINQKKYHRTGKGLSGYDMQSFLPKLKKQYPWLKEANSQSLQIVCHNLADAYSKFFQKKGGYPKFKKKGAKQSFSAITNCQLFENQIKLPKIKLIKFRGGKRPEGKTKGFTISKDATGYYVSILFDNGKKNIIEQEVNNVLGIDLGIKDFATLSNGKKVKNINFTKCHARRLRKWQKALARRIKGSKKREQAKRMVSKIHKKIANQRLDFAHKISRQIVNSCDNQTAIAVESLAVSNMMKNHKLAKSIADCGWSQFGTFLKYKASDVGKQVIEIGRFYPSSKTCSSCGVVKENLTLAIREWQCNHCQTKHDRDLNAAINIAMEGARIYKAGRKLAGGEDISLDLILQSINQAASLKPLTYY
jgi:putative transposase